MVHQYFSTNCIKFVKNKDLKCILFLELFEGIRMFLWSLLGFPALWRVPKFEIFYFLAWSNFVEWFSLSGSTFFLAGIRLPAPRVKIRQKSHFVSNWFIGLDKFKLVNRPKILFFNVTRPNSWLEIANARSLLQVKARRWKGFVTSNPRGSWIKKLKEDFFSW